MTVALSGVTVSGVTFHAFAPSSLFAAGEQGAWYDPSDFTTMFQDEAGTTPVTAFEQSVGRILDKSGRGNHATTPAAATTSRPILSARYNLLTKTQEFDDAVWTKTRSSVPVTNFLAPDGTSTADLLREDSSATTTHFVNCQVATAGDVIYSVYAKAKERKNLSIQLDQLANGNNGATATFNVDPSTASAGVVGTYGTGFSASSSSITSVGNDWYLCQLRVTVTSATLRAYVFLRDGTTPYGSATYTGDGISGLYIWGADLRVANDGVGIPPYQYVNTSTNYTTNGFPPYLLFDGVDDYMLTGTITPGTDKAQVFAGVRKLSDANYGTIVEYSADSGSVGTTGVFGVFGANSAAWQFQVKGSGSPANTRVASTYASPITNGLSSIFDLGQTLAADEVSPRINGVVPSSTQSGGPFTGNFGNYPLYIGRRGGTTLPFNGRLYSLIVRFGANLTTDQIVQTETWVNSETKAY